MLKMLLKAFMPKVPILFYSTNSIFHTPNRNCSEQESKKESNKKKAENSKNKEIDQLIDKLLEIVDKLEKLKSGS